MPKIYIKSRQMQDVKSVEYQGRCYVPTGDTTKISDVVITDINQTQPYYGACVTCRAGEVLLNTTTTEVISAPMTQLELATTQVNDTFVMSMTASDQTTDYLAIRVDPTGVSVYASNSTGDPIGQTHTIGLKSRVYVNLASNSSVTIEQPVDGVYLLFRSVEIDFTTLTVPDPNDPTQRAAPYQQLSLRVMSDPYTSNSYELKINDTVQDVNSTGVFNLITTGDNNVDEITVTGYDNNNVSTTTSNILKIRTDNILAKPPIEHGGKYYASTADTYNFSTTDLGNNNLDVLNDRLRDHGFILDRVVRVQDFFDNSMLWDEIGTTNIIGKVVSNYNNIVDRYNYQDECIFLTNSTTSDSVGIYYQNTVLDCKTNTSSPCSTLKGYYLTSHGVSKPVLVCMTT